MAIKVKPMARIVEKWQAGSSAGSADYAANSVAAASDYGAKAGAAQAAWKAGVIGPGADARYAANTRGKGQAKYARKIASVGAARYAEGVSNAGQDYSAGFSPYVQVLQGLTTPARGPRGSPGNQAISAAVAKALHDRRVGQTGAGR
jgi:hypothetical protein